MEIDLTACIQGDKAAWDGFVLRFSALIRHVARSVVGRYLGSAGDSEVEDAVQEVFLRLLKDQCRLLRSYDASRSALTTWLTIVARSTTVDLLRRLPARTAPLDGPALKVAAPHREPRMLRAIEAGVLSPRQRLVLHLLFDRDMDVAEVAELLGLEAQTVRSTKHKALAALRRFYGANKES